MEFTQILILFAIVAGVVIFLRLLKATLKLIIIIAIIVLIAGYFGLDLLEIGRDVYDRVEEPAVELIDSGLNMDFWDENGEAGMTDRLHEPIMALRDLGFSVDVSEQEIDFWEGETFQGNLDVEESNLFLEVNLEDRDNKDVVSAVIKGLDEETVSAEAKDQILQAINSKEDEQIDFREGYMEITDGRMNLKIKSTGTY